MDRLETIQFLIGILLEEMPQYRHGAQRTAADAASQRRLLRSLMNLRPPRPLREDFLRAQDRLLSKEREEKGVVDVSALTASGRIALWRGDITRLGADAIVNAANSALLGCFYPCHDCIDNAIHSAAGLQLREECHELMERQGREEPVGGAKVTGGYNLPAKYVIHTVGPVVEGRLDDSHCRALARCYRSCMEAAGEKGCRSVAFCCISTGEFRFPRREAARIAVDAVKGCLELPNAPEKVIFDVFTEEDYGYYRELLPES